MSEQLGIEQRSVPRGVREAETQGALLPLLVLGGPAPSELGFTFYRDAVKPFTAILLVGAVSAGEFTLALDRAQDPAVPVADFAGNSGLRHDFSAAKPDLESLLAFVQKIGAIRARLAAIPFSGSREDRGALAALRLAYSRETAILASFAHDSPQLVEYSLLGRKPGQRQELEQLAGLGLLHRRHYTRTHHCSACDSARLHAYEACRNCGGSDLVDEAIVHHYRCGAQEPESHFVDGHNLLCPKCRRTLRHLGVDYDKPGTLVVCRKCGTSHSEPVASFACLDCKTVTPADSAQVSDWYHYDLTEDGIRALYSNELPRLDISSLVQGHTRVFSIAEFRLLATEAARVASRYRRPFTLMRLAIADIELLRARLGPVKLDSTFRLAVSLILESLRESDFVSGLGPSAVLIGLPETDAKYGGHILHRLRQKLDASVAEALQIEADIQQGDAALDLLDASAR